MFLRLLRVEVRNLRGWGVTLSVAEVVVLCHICGSRGVTQRRTITISIENIENLFKSFEQVYWKSIEQLSHILLNYELIQITVIGKLQ